MPGHFLGSNAADWGSEFGAITIDLFNGTDSSQKEQFISSVSKLSGVLSLSVWLFAQLPQIIENHLNESVSGVSLLFLLCWIGGDTTNLLGCILTKALPFQTSLAAYYCFIDCILSLQYWYYTRVFPKHRIHHNLLQSPNMLRPTTSRKSARHSTRRNRFEDDVNRSPMQITISHNVHTPHQESFIHKILGASFISSSLGKQAQSMPVPIKDATVDIVVNTAQIGKISAWTCTVLYISSRAPQIIKNHKSGSTKGISVYLFLFAMLGNVFYTISIGGDSEFNEIFMDQLPFIVGSAGTVCFDMVILFQCWLYS
ncbi:PQ loop repeat-domain-containing protein, partial [Scheffersomyces xylosifermentans]|uniref:PQ loop repeat-domain-containing protein n=1 Tax=Scheffersomyces xylosifermentans TaxID=1304137 RepID=UPI00315D0E8E